MFAIGDNGITILVEPVTVSEFVRPFVDTRLKFESQINLFSLDQQVLANPAKETRGLLACDDPAVKRLVSLALPFLRVQGASKEAVHEQESFGVSHVDPSDNLHDFTGSGLARGNPDVPLSIEQSGGVVDVAHVKSSQAVDGMLANSVDIRCPARKGAEGQYRAKQGLIDPGVCNEHVPTPEGKICSALHGNMQRAAEMTAPVHVLAHGASIYEQVTEGNTNYLELVVHRDADLTVMDDIRPVNQDGSVTPILWMGNLTCSNRKMQGVIKP